MKRESIVFAIAGAFFGLLVGWVLGSQQGSGRAAPAAAPLAQPAGSSAQAAPARALDERRVESLRAAALQNAKDPAPREELGNLYYDAEQYTEAIRWYEQALELDPRNINVSTDLGVCYYYTNQPDRALQQFEVSLKIDPRHAKTLLNMGIVRAFGKQDLAGATEAWQRVIEIAPDSQEGRAAKQAIDSMNAAHAGLGQATSGSGTSPKD